MRRENKMKLGVTAKLPGDLVIEILYRLPVKSICRFKSVCKSWNSLFSSYLFAKSHLDKSRRNPYSTSGNYLLRIMSKYEDEPKGFWLNLTSYQSSTTLRSNSCHEESNNRTDAFIKRHFMLKCLSDKKSKDISSIALLGCSNGLVCLTFWVRLVGQKYVIFNPVSRECKILPPTPQLIKGYCIIPTFSAFGYDPMLDDYKVILIGGISCGKRNTNACVFSARTNSWTIHENRKNAPTGRRDVIYSNGTIYWVKIERGIVRIFTYHVIEDTLQEVYNCICFETSNYAYGCCCEIRPGVLNGCVCCAMVFKSSDFTLLKILEKEKETGELSVTKIINIPRNAVIFGSNAENIRFIDVLAEGDDGSVLLQVIAQGLVRHDEDDEENEMLLRGLVWYNPRNNVFEDEELILQKANDFNIIVSCQETMISPFI